MCAGSQGAGPPRVENPTAPPPPDPHATHTGASGTGDMSRETLNVQIGLASASPPPGRIKVAVQANGAPVTINSFYSPSPTLQGHPGAAAVGAANFLQTPRCAPTLP